MKKFEMKLLELIEPTGKWKKESWFGATIYCWTWDNDKYCVSISVVNKRIISYVVSDENTCFYTGKSQKECLRIIGELLCIK